MIFRKRRVREDAEHIIAESYKEHAQTLEEMLQWLSNRRATIEFYQGKVSLLIDTRFFKGETLFDAYLDARFQEDEDDHNSTRPR